VLLFVGKYVYDMNINHNFEPLLKGKYINPVIPPDEIESYVKKYHIKSIRLTYARYKRLCFKSRKEELEAEKQRLQKGGKLFQ
jgi:hypothetical protein